MASPENRGGGRGRSRIVIDVDNMRTERRRRHLGRYPRAKKMLAIAGLLILAAIAGGYFWWQSYKRGPSYSVALLVDAAQRDDVRAVETLIDSDKIAEGFVPQVADKLVEGVGAARLEPVRRQIEGAMPQLLPRIRETMRDEVAKQMKAVSGTEGNKSFLLIALSAPYFWSVKRDGDAATVRIDIKDRPVELTMQRTIDDHWKVVGVKDAVLASEIAVRLASALPPTGEPVQQNEARPPTRAPKRKPPSAAAPKPAGGPV